MENEIEKLTKPQKVRITVNKSVYDGLERLCYYSLRIEDRIKTITKSFEKIILMYQKSSSIGVEDKPIKELKEFWEEVSQKTGYEFSKLEMQALSTDRGAPSTFLGHLLHLAYEQEKYHSAQTYLEPIFSRIKQLG